MKNFLLRPLVPEDAESFARQLNNKKIWDNLRDGLPFPYTPQDGRAFIQFQADDPSLTCYGIVVDGEVVGNIGFTRSHDVERFTAEVGYYLGEAYWGKGIMTAALREAVADYFANTDAVRLFATPYAYNNASAKVLEKAGFTFKCTLSQAAYKNNRFVDMLYYEKVK